MDSLLGAKDQKARRNQKLVGDRVEHAAERGLLPPNAGKITVKKIGDAGRDKDDEREPAQPKPAMKDVLPEEAADHERHGDYAAISQNIRQRHRVGARSYRSLRRNMSRIVCRRMSGRVPGRAGCGRIHSQCPLPTIALRRPGRQARLPQLWVYGDDWLWITGQVAPSWKKA